MKKFAIILVILLLCCAALSLSACKHEDVVVTIGEKSFVLELADTKAAQELEKALPLTVKMTSVNGQYVHGNVNSATFTQQLAESGVLDMGDIMLQGNNELMLFYSVNTSNDMLTRIGRITQDERTAFANAIVKALQSSTTITIKISKGA